MTMLALTLLGLALVASVLGLVRAVRSDGLGDREPPRSHPQDAGGAPPRRSAPL